MKNKILNVLSILLGLLMINGGLNKFFEYIPVPDDLPEAMVKLNASLMEISWLIPLVAFAELVGGLLILIPKTRALGALIVFPIMVGILMTSIINMPEGLPLTLILWAVLLWIIYENRKKYLALLG
ncbi:MAG: DoxX family membrane protein [Flavobacteriales bacterium]|nr:DoxX family membrane protein [Flavobacteriales bacterium]